MQAISHTKLLGVIRHVDYLMVVSNHHDNNIGKVILKVFPNASHGVCIYHLRQNLKTKFKNVVIHTLFHDIAYTHHLLEFNVI